MNRLAPILVIAMLASGVTAESFTLRNIHSRGFADECLRIPVRVPADQCRVTVEGKELPSVVYVVEGEKVLWVRASIAPGATQELQVVAGKPSEAKSGVTVKEDKGFFVIDNGKAAVRIPAKTGDGIPAPIAQVRFGGKWVGQGRWSTTMPLKSFAATVVDDGRVFGKVRLRYEFDGTAGINSDVPAYAEVDITLMPNQPFAVIEERHEMDRLSAWEFVTTEGWKASGSFVRPHSGGMGNTTRRGDLKGTLKMGQCGNQDPALMINLFPRWNQHCKDGWVGAATGADGGVGALVILAGHWYWPHDNAIQCLVDESGDTMTMRCPTRRGMRYWWLLAGERKLFESAQGLATRHGLESLDTIVNSIAIRDWPGKGGSYRGYWPLGNHINPTGGVRGWGRNAMKNAGKAIDGLAHLTNTQVLDSPHTYGSYWLYWSPENPNFFTDFNKVPIGMYCNLRNHPRFKELARMAIQKFKEDMYHSITMPSGAGNECPGYQQYAMKHYLEMAHVCRDHLGEDATKWPRFKAGAGFAIHLSQPLGNGRRGSHPGGDTHGGYRHSDPREFAHKFGVEEDVGTFKSEELQGFGAVLRNRCGSDAETYFAFKSGPSRGHFHGDQLSFHYVANARLIALDFGCSYGPRGAQEHLHNRLAFSTEDMPYACMDGYERLIALKTSDKVDVAMGQVESWRLRGVRDIGSENWHDEWPLKWFKGKPLAYRRTVVLLKGEPDIFVIRDQYDSPMELDIAYPLHVRDNETVTGAHAGNGIEISGATVKDAESDFAELGVQPGWIVTLGPKGKNMDTQYAVKEVKGNTLVLDRDVTEGADSKEYVLLKPLYEAEGQTVHFKSMSLYRAHPAEAKLRFFPWFHYNGGLEASQGVRMETRGRSGEYVTVLIPRTPDAPKSLPEPAAIPNGVRVGNAIVTFGGGIDDDDATTYVNVQVKGKELLMLGGRDIDLNRSQGEVGLFVPDAGYPFGEIPNWLVRQRIEVPDWAPDWAKKIRSRRQ